MSSKRANGISRGELARRTGVNGETIRYFERAGILAEPPRTAGGHRVYDQSHVRTLSFVRRARGLGFTPKEVKAILQLGGPGVASCADVREIAALHLEQVKGKIADLQQIECLLADTIERCPCNADPECAIIDMIEDSTVVQSMEPMSDGPVG